jgi:SpoVK/Ycf46/Vps4 family AAA+-type ATPase
MNHTLVALGSARLADGDDDSVGTYRLDLLNADCDLERLREGLQRVGDGRMCLYGPPGTGKTAFGRHVADYLGRPLLVRRASDILSPYVGEAERNIASMFEQARQDRAVLLLDEADSLLRERRGAQRSWEVTQVNEMLTQMESFRGVFIASTNLIDSLDEAAMRRFDACIRLGYLGPRQAWGMFTALATNIGLSVPDDLRSRLHALQVLTPGDFAAVARGARLDAARTADELLERLVKLCNAKNDRRQRPIGFVTSA